MPDTNSRSSQPWRTRLVPWTVGAIQLLASLGYWLNRIPLEQLFARIICGGRFLEHGREDGKFCGIGEVYADVAYYVWLVWTLEMVCGKAGFKTCWIE